MKNLHISTFITITVMPVGVGLLSASRQWIVTKNENNTWPISFTKCVGVIPSLCVALEETESFVKSVYGYRGGIKFSETGFSTWYDRNSNGDVVHDINMRFFGIGVIK